MHPNVRPGPSSITYLAVGNVRPLQGQGPRCAQVPKALPWAIAFRRVAAGTPTCPEGAP
jgi:hypothetical protein